MFASVKVFVSKPLVAGALWFSAGVLSTISIQRAAKTVSESKAKAKAKADKEAAEKAEPKAA